MNQRPLERILYVEDDADIREVVRMSLELVGGYQVAVCASCSEALRLAPEFAPDVLLLDVMMPDTDGPETLRALRALPAAAAAPAIFITAKVQAGDLAAYRAMGVIDVIVKPFDPMQLPKQIDRIWTEARADARD